MRFSLTNDGRGVLYHNYMDNRNPKRPVRSEAAVLMESSDKSEPRIWVGEFLLNAAEVETVIAQLNVWRETGKLQRVEQ